MKRGAVKMNAVIVLLLSFMESVSSHATHSKLLVISLDGFRHDYLDKVKAYNATPNFDRLIKEGVYGEMLNIFPTKTLPNHYTLATGLYAENHGIVQNTFYDPAYNATFSPYQPGDMKSEKWFNGTNKNQTVEPIWLTNQNSKQTLFPKRSGVFNWPGSEAPFHSKHASRYEVFNTDVAEMPLADLAFKTMVNWFTNEEMPINFGMVYHREPDYVGHIYGPDSSEVREKILQHDASLGVLIEELEHHNLYDDMNIIVTSDHGMASIINTEYLSDYINSSLYQLYGSSPVLLIKPNSGKEQEVYTSLKGGLKNVEVYFKQLVPKKYHYSNNRRIMDIVLVAHLGTRILQDKTQNSTSKGDHGYSNEEREMHPIFIARGPAFRRNFTLPEMIRSIDFYELMCSILDIKPNVNDGDLEKIKYILNDEEEDENADKYTVVTFLAVLVFTATISGICCISACRVYRINIRHRKQLRPLLGRHMPINSHDNSSSHLLEESEDEI